VNMDTGEFAALTARVSQLETAYADLAERLYQATAAEEVLRRAGYGEPVPRPAPRGPRRLRAVR
jgi:hypothetical protein